MEISGPDAIHSPVAGLHSNMQMEPTSLKIILLLILTLHFVLERWMDFLNFKAMKPELPNELNGIYDADKYRLSQSYNKERGQLGLWSSTLSFALSFFLIASGGFGWIEAWIKTQSGDVFIQTGMFFGILMLGGDVLSLPFSIYGIFRIEEKYGFNKTTLATFFLDKLKGYVLGGLIGGILLWLFLLLLDQFGSGFWWIFWIVVVLFLFLMNILYVPIVLPLFNRLSPLDKGELKDEIESYSSRNSFPATKIMVMDGSKRSTKANAFFSGFGRTKRVVLYDTLVKEYSVPQLVAVLAHEVGHYKLRHILQGYLASILQTGLMLFLLSRILFSESLSLSLGGDSRSFALNLIAFSLLFSPLSTLLGIGMNVLSRKNEYEADAFAKQTSDGTALKEALIKLHRDSLSNLTPHPAYVFMHYSHPSLLQRVSKLNS